MLSKDAQDFVVQQSNKQQLRIKKKNNFDQFKKIVEGIIQ